MIKALIFDLDDTIFSNLEQIHLPFLKEAVRTMAKEGFNCTIEEGFEAIKRMSITNPLGNPFRDFAARYAEAGHKIADIGAKAYISRSFTTLSAFPNAEEVLAKLKEKYLLMLVSCGNREVQEKKIAMLGIGKLFDLIILCEKKSEREFERALSKFKLEPKEAVCIGNRIDSEITIGNKLGMTTILLKHGKYSSLIAESDYENPDYTIEKFSQLIDVVRSIEDESLDESILKKGPRVVAIGGGTGLPTLLEGIKRYTSNITAIVAVTDSGRSSGKLRKEFGVLPPGDIRNCLIALSRSEKRMHDIFQYRFDDGDLKGHTIGNLFITALTKITGSFEKSIRMTSRILDLRGKVLPCTTENADLCAELEDGSIVEEEVNVRAPGKAKIKRIFIRPGNAEPLDEALDDIKDADIIILGPGALYTSVLPNLLVKGIPEAIRLSKAKKIYICNIMTQPGETEAMTASDHTNAVIEYLGDNVIDYVILNSKKPISRIIENYRKEGKYLVSNDSQKIMQMGIRVIEADLVEKIRERRLLWEKPDLLRHDSIKMARIIMKMLIKEKIFEVAKQNESSGVSGWKRDKDASFNKNCAKGLG